MPPQVSTDENKLVPLGDYPKFTNEPHNNFESFAESELIDALSSQEINFTKSGRSNNILGQMFEISKNGTTKLTTIDYGEFVSENQKKYRVFYLGKPIRDLNGTAKFCKLFTMVFEK